MISLAAKRRFGPWLLGLFLVAQLLGVAPLMSGHTAHVAGSHVALSGQHGHEANTGHAQHRHGDSDSGMQHHAMHDITGVFATPLPAEAADIAHVASFTPPPDALATAEPALLERPPKSFLSV